MHRFNHTQHHQMHTQQHQTAMQHQQQQQIINTVHQQQQQLIAQQMAEVHRKQNLNMLFHGTLGQRIFAFLDQLLRS